MSAKSKRLKRRLESSQREAAANFKGWREEAAKCSRMGYRNQDLDKEVGRLRGRLNGLVSVYIPEHQRETYAVQIRLDRREIEMYRGDRTHYIRIIAEKMVEDILGVNTKASALDHQSQPRDTGGKK